MRPRPATVLDMEVDDVNMVLKTSTGVAIEVWRDGDLYHARRAGDSEEPQICLAIDLFEVIAELGGLELDGYRDSEEAVHLASTAQRHLARHEPVETRSGGCSEGADHRPCAG